MLEFLLALVCFLLLVISFTVSIPILCMCEIFAQFLKICLSITHGEWFELVKNFDAFFLIEKKSKEANITINSYLIFQGTFHLEDIRNTVQTKWTDLKEKNEYKHPLLRKHIVDSCGYFFWAPDKNFSIDDHVQLYNCKPPKHQSELDDLCSQLCRQPLPENKSPWLILLFQLDESLNNEPQYVIFLRCHHCLGDGYNLIHMVNHCFIDEKYISNLPIRSPKPISTYNLLKALFYFPKYSIECLLSKESNILHGPPQTGKRFYAPLISYSLVRVKKVAKTFGATINDVLVSCIAGAIKRYFRKHKALPLRNVHCAIPVAMPLEHEDIGFRTSVSISRIPFALSDNSALERLKSTQKNANKSKDLPFYYFTYLVIRLNLNRLPANVTNIFYQAIGITCLITNILFHQTVCFDKHGKQLVTYNAFPVHNSNTALAFAISSFNGTMRVGMSADEAIMQQEDVDTVLKSVVEEFEELEIYSLKEQ